MDYRKKIKIPSSGFTLIELLTVIAIVGLLGSIIFAITRGTGEQGRIARGLYFSQHLQNSLGAYAIGIWRMNEGSGSTVNDTSGWGNNGTATGSPTWRCAIDDKNYTPSEKGCSLQFNTSSQYINFGSKESFNIRDKITLAAWIKMNGYTNFDTFLWRTNTGASGNQSCYGLSMTEGQKGRFAIFDKTLISDKVFPLNTWFFMVGTYDGNYMNLYYNGELAANPLANSAQIASSSQDLTLAIRKFNTSFSYPANVLIYEAYIYSTALTASQIQSQYYAGLRNLLAKGQINKQEYQQKLIDI
jgi:prepilin-type N-terminal cleavage/methylation domain-containing protein